MKSDSETSDVNVCDDPFALSSAEYDIALNRGLSITGESKYYFAERRLQWLRTRLSALQVRANAILDYGCGSGTSIRLLREILGAERIVGVDSSTPLLEDARRGNDGIGAEFFLIDNFRPESLPRDTLFDLAFCNGVFHHIPPKERPAAVRYVSDCLRPGGIFALWENNPYNPGTHLVMRRIPFDRDAQLLTPKQARTLLSNQGFAPIETTSLFLFPRFLAPLRIIEPFVAKIPIGAQYLVLARKS